MSGDACAPKVWSKNFQDVFYNLSLDMLPPLDRLLRPELSRSEKATDQTVGRIPEDKSGDILKSIQNICRHYGYIPLLVELAVVSDPRFMSVSEEPFFISYVQAHEFLDESVTDAYLDALKTMAGKDGESEGRQVVPNKQLYGEEKTLIEFEYNIDEELEALSIPDDYAMDQCKYAPARVEKTGFIIDDDSETDVVKLVEIFLKIFARKIQEKCKEEDDYKALNNSKGIVLPLVRPRYRHRTETNSKIIEKGFQRGLPAGVLFLFLQPCKKNGNGRTLHELVHALSWLFAQATLKEATLYAEIYNGYREEYEKNRRVFGILAHETGRLFRKTYPDVGDELRKGNPTIGPRVAEAWERIHATVDLAYLFAASTGSASKRGSVKEKIGKVFHKLWKEERLELAFRYIVEQIYVEQDLAGYIHLDVMDRLFPKDFDLEPEEYAPCYLITAEIIRNLRHAYIRGCRNASWHVEDRGEEGYWIWLIHDFKYRRFPASETFTTLGDMLEVIGAGETDCGWYREKSGRECYWRIKLRSDFVHYDWEIQE